MNQSKKIILLGDHHGDWQSVLQIIDRLLIRDCLLICVGDGGEGFQEKTKQMHQFQVLNHLFEKRGITYWSIRGNHSDPQYFDGSVCLSNFELLPDYTTRTINNEKFLFIGGAISVDRLARTPEVSWWSGEGIVFKPELISECDVLITHSAPHWIGPNDKEGINWWCEKDLTLWEDCVKERRIMNEIFQLAKPKFAYMGHFHQSCFVDLEGCRARILDINEFFEHLPYGVGVSHDKMS
jgi:hypothetical protein